MGSHECIDKENACRPGEKSVDGKCVDIDECLERSPCQEARFYMVLFQCFELLENVQRILSVLITAVLIAAIVSKATKKKSSMIEARGPSLETFNDGRSIMTLAKVRFVSTSTSVCTIHVEWAKTRSVPTLSEAMNAHVERVTSYRTKPAKRTRVAASARKSRSPWMNVN